jgi:hypothetical protein
MRLHPLVPAVGLFAAALSTASCAPPPPVETPVEAVAAPPPAEVPAAPPVSYDPVPEPEGMLATVRIGSPLSDLRAVREVVTPRDEFWELLLSEPYRVANIFLGSLGPHVDLTAPIDAVFFDEADNSPSAIVMSFVIRDLERARQGAGFEFNAEPDGRFTMKPRPEAGQAAGIIAKQGLSCAVFPGGMPVTSHLVCAASQDRLDRAGPYLARNVSRMPVQRGMRMDFPESQLRKALDKAQRKGESRSGSLAEMEGLRIGQQIGLACVADMRDMALDVQFGISGVTAGFDLRFRSLNSPLSMAMLGSQAQVPPAFWKLPADADMAFYFPGAPPEEIQAAAAPIWASIAAADLGAPGARTRRGEGPS